MLGKMPTTLVRRRISLFNLDISFLLSSHFALR